MVQPRFPTIDDFRRYGRLHQAPVFDAYTPLPGDILAFIFPNYYLMDDKAIPEDKLIKLTLFCLNLRKQAEYEDFVQDLNDQKELQLRRLEEKIKHQIKKKK